MTLPKADLAPNLDEVGHAVQAPLGLRRGTATCLVWHAYLRASERATSAREPRKWIGPVPTLASDRCTWRGRPGERREDIFRTAAAIFRTGLNDDSESRARNED
jgi:hypothetical protein